MENYIITVARGFGSGGKRIGMRLAGELGIPCYENQILTMASDESGINRELFAEVDEKLRGSYIVNRLKGLPSEYIIEPSKKNFVSDVNLFNFQAKIIRELARTQSCVIIGKCADYILRDEKNVLSVFVSAPMEFCVATVMDKLCVSEAEAERMVIKTDKYRGDYYRYYSGGKAWNDPANYDLCLNSERLGDDGCIAAIKNMLTIKGLNT